MLTPLLLCSAPLQPPPQYDSTFAIIQSFAHKMAATAPDAVPGCTPRGGNGSSASAAVTPSNTSGNGALPTNNVPLLPADGTSQPAGRKLLAGGRRG